MVHSSPPVLTFKDSHCSAVHNPAWKNPNNTALELLHKMIFAHRLPVRTDTRPFIPQTACRVLGPANTGAFSAAAKQEHSKRRVSINQPFVPLLQKPRLVKTQFGALCVKTHKKPRGEGERGGRSGSVLFTKRVDTLVLNALRRGRGL